MMDQPAPAHTKVDAHNADADKPASPSQDPNPIQTHHPNSNPDNSDAANPTTEDNNINECSGKSSAEENTVKSQKLRKSVTWSQELVTEKTVPRDSDRGLDNSYVNYSPVQNSNSSSFNFQETMGSVKDVLGRWGKKVGEATRKAEDFVGNTWQHLKTSPSLADAALGRIAQSTKVLAEGGYEKIFRQTFETVPEEQLRNSFACYLSTSAGPVMGVLYVSTVKVAFCSDNPLSYEANDKTEWSYYKVVIPLHQLKAFNSSISKTNSSEKYIQVISVDNHEFWYMGFLNYNGAVKCLQESLQANEAHQV